MNRSGFRAMGTDIVAIGGNGLELERWFGEAEFVFSRFRADTELSLLNEAAGPSVVVSDLLAACLGTAADLQTRTGGLVDPAVGGAVIGWGYDRTFADVADRDDHAPIPALGEWSIEGNLVTRQRGVQLDLGGIAKGWTCDQAVERGLAGVVSAGGDVRSSHSDTVVDVQDPWGETAARVVLGKGGLATSSSTRRRWTVGGAQAHHIIDPRRMAPATSPVFSATVTAPTAVEAEAGAKAVLLHGVDGLAWAEKQNWIDAALVVWHDGNVYATTGWEMAA